VASGSCRESVEVKVLRHQDVFKLFSHMVNGSEVQHGKPAPDVFYLAISRFSQKVEPSSVC
jgi:pseudouridine-5'-monophosphatase